MLGVPYLPPLTHREFLRPRPLHKSVHSPLGAESLKSALLLVFGAASLPYTPEMGLFCTTVLSVSVTIFCITIDFVRLPAPTIMTCFGGWRALWHHRVGHSPSQSAEATGQSPPAAVDWQALWAAPFVAMPHQPKVGPAQPPVEEPVSCPTGSSAYSRPMWVALGTRQHGSAPNKWT